MLVELKKAAAKELDKLQRTSVPAYNACVKMVKRIEAAASLSVAVGQLGMNITQIKGLGPGHFRAKQDSFRMLFEMVDSERIRISGFPRRNESTYN